MACSVNRTLGALLLALFPFPSLVMVYLAKYENLVKPWGLCVKECADVPFSENATGATQGAFNNGMQAGP